MNKPVKKKHYQQSTFLHYIIFFIMLRVVEHSSPKSPAKLPVALSQVNAIMVQRDLIWHHISQPLKTDMCLGVSGCGLKMGIEF